MPNGCAYEARCGRQLEPQPPPPQDDPHEEEDDPHEEDDPQDEEDPQPPEPPLPPLDQPPRRRRRRLLEPPPFTAEVKPITTIAKATMMKSSISVPPYSCMPFRCSVPVFRSGCSVSDAPFPACEGDSRPAPRPKRT
ncbi:hypothetical protein [Streptomyces sp. NPDC046385]|uniref:hypothetical protein n=1 Tax=unclassified Streptomyces TaxID=2593676 RepID=UPI0033C2D2CB